MSTIPDLLVSTGNLSAFLDGAHFKRQHKDDPETDLGLFDVTLDINFSLQDQVVDQHPRYLRGAAEALVAAKQGKGTTFIRYEPLDSEREVRISLARGEAFEICEDAGAEVRVLEVVATSESPRLEAKVKVVGLTSEQCGRLLEAWRRSIDLRLEPVQASLLDARKKAS